MLHDELVGLSLDVLAGPRRTTARAAVTAYEVVVTVGCAFVLVGAA
jgi:hypothetical protein